MTRSANSKKMNPLTVQIAFSPDSDDAFMIRDLQTIHIPGVELSFKSAEIEILNQLCISGQGPDISAVSAAAYPAMQAHYQILPVGQSVGDGYGPVVVSRRATIETLDDLAGRRVAVPGITTSAVAALKCIAPPFEAIPYPFDRVEAAVLSGEVDAGVLIHEAQMMVEEKGYHQVVELGKAWKEQFEIPLPLGLIVIRRSLPKDIGLTLLEAYRNSIATALAKKPERLGDLSLETGYSVDLLDRYLKRYANEHSVSSPYEEVIENFFTILMRHEVVDRFYLSDIFYKEARFDNISTGPHEEGSLSRRDYELG